MTTLEEAPAARDGGWNKEGSEMPAAKTPELTEREVELLRGIVSDKTYAQIAFSMGVGLETVKCYTARIRAKLGVDSKVGLALWAERNLKDQ